MITADTIARVLDAWLAISDAGGSVCLMLHGRGVVPDTVIEWCRSRDIRYTDQLHHTATGSSGNYASLVVTRHDSSSSLYCINYRDLTPAEEDQILNARGGK